MPTYTEIKKELEEISKLIDAYPESLQTQVFELLINKYLGTKDISTVTVKDKKTVGVKETKKEVEKPKKSKVTKTRESYNIIKDLVLNGGKDYPSFIEFYEEKKPKSGIEFNAVAIYYLSKTLELTGITIEHVYTCYRKAGKKPPKWFRQSINDTSGSKYGYIDASNINDLKIPHSGVTFVEHELPRIGKKERKK